MGMIYWMTSRLTAREHYWRVTVFRTRLLIDTGCMCVTSIDTKVGQMRCKIIRRSTNSSISCTEKEIEYCNVEVSIDNAVYIDFIIVSNVSRYAGTLELIRLSVQVISDAVIFV